MDDTPMTVLLDGCLVPLEAFKRAVGAFYRDALPLLDEDDADAAAKEFARMLDLADESARPAQPGERALYGREADAALRAFVSDMKHRWFEAEYPEQPS